LLASGVSPTIALGSSANDGSGNTGANSIGSADIATVYSSVPQIYRQSEKCVWLMSENTLGFLQKLLDKFGHPILPLRWDKGDTPTLYGKDVKIDPNMPDIAASANTVIFGDLSYFGVRRVPLGIRVYKEAVGLVENGNVALQLWDRFDSNFLWAGDGFAKSPIGFLQQHS
jgi:HK97 family phage major capsid protein